MSGNEKKLLAFVLYPGVTPLDLVGPLTVLRNLEFGTPYRTVVVGERPDPVATDTTLRIVPARTFREVPEPFAVIVPGGGVATLDTMQDPAVLAYVRSAAETAEIVGATGNGALVLAAAGLLQGRRAATHWAYGDHLQSLGVRYVRERWVEDGKFLTSAGGAAGIDMMLQLLARLSNKSNAVLSQLFMEYDPQPPFGGIDWSQIDTDVAGVLGVPQRV